MHFKSNEEQIAENNKSFPLLSVARVMLATVFELSNTKDVALVCTVGVDTEGCGFNRFHLHPVATMEQHLASDATEITPDLPWLELIQGANIISQPDVDEVMATDIIAHLYIGEHELRDENYPFFDVDYIVKESIEHLVMGPEEVKELHRQREEMIASQATGK